MLIELREFFYIAHINQSSLKIRVLVALKTLVVFDGPSLFMHLTGIPLILEAKFNAN